MVTVVSTNIYYEYYYEGMKDGMVLATIQLNTVKYRPQSTLALAQPLFLMVEMLPGFMTGTGSGSGNTLDWK